MTGWLALASCAATLLGAGSAFAQDRPPPRPFEATTGFFYRTAVFARLNPLGLFVDARAGMRWRLFNAPDRPVILQNTYASIGASVVASPAFVRPGIVAEVQPVQMLNLQVSYEPVVQWFGTFGNLQTFDDAHANFSDAGLSRNRDVAGTVQTARGWQLSLQATLQTRIGPWFALRDTVRGVYANYATSTLTSGHTRLYYDPSSDVLALTDGWVVTNDLDAIVRITRHRLNVGVRYTVVAPLLGSAGADDVATTTHRVGPLVSYTFYERDHGWFNAPTVYVMAQWWLVHPWRTGGPSPDATSQAVPMFVAGFSFRGDA